MSTVETAKSGIGFAHIFGPEFAVYRESNKKQQNLVNYQRFFQFKTANFGTLNQILRHLIIQKSVKIAGLLTLYFHFQPIMPFLYITYILWLRIDIN